MLVRQVVENFDSMGLKDELLRGVYAYGFERPSAVQQRAVKPITSGRDVIAQSQACIALSLSDYGWTRRSIGPLAYYYCSHELASSLRTKTVRFCRSTTVCNLHTTS